MNIDDSIIINSKMEHHIIDHTIHGSHMHLNDSHHTTINLDPTHVDPQHGIICGHGEINYHPFDHGSLSGIETKIGIDGCIGPNVHGGIDFIGKPDVTAGVGFNW